MFCHNGNSPLHIAAENHNIDIVRILLDHGASINAKGAQLT